MNPYLIMLKMKKLPASPLTELPQVPFVSSVSKANRPFHKIRHPFVSSVSDTDMPVSKIRPVCEFMELDSTTLTDTRTLALSSVKPRQAGEWLALFADFDVLIERYCTAVGITYEARNMIQVIRCFQPLPSIPDSLSWFKAELDRIENSKIS